MIVQRYIENPLLINGKKFDIRVFMIISCMKPYLVLYNHGYARLSLNQYTTDDYENNLVTHLTNNSV